MHMNGGPSKSLNGEWIRLLIGGNTGGAGGRILISLVGLILVVWGTASLMLGFIGEQDTAVITSIRRQGGERAEATPGRYTYSIGYTFTLPDGRGVDGTTTKVSSAVYLKADGISTLKVRYLKAAPFINAPEAEAGFSLGSIVLLAAGIFLIFIVNRKSNEEDEDDVYS